MVKENSKDVVYYENILKMWIDNRMILTKSIFNISAGGIGILITFIGNFKLQTHPQKISFILALVFLILTLGICLCIYLFNSKHLEKVFNEKEDRSITLIVLSILSASTLIVALSCAGYMTYLSIFNNDKNKGEIYQKTKTAIYCHCPLMGFSKCDQQAPGKSQAISMAFENCSQIKVQIPTKTLKTNKEVSSMSEKKKSANTQSQSNKSSNFNANGIAKMQPTKSGNSSQGGKQDK